MTEKLIALCILLFILIIAFLFVIRSLSKKFDDVLKNSVYKGISAYDDLITSKEKELENISKAIEEIEEKNIIEKNDLSIDTTLNFIPDNIQSQDFIEYENDNFLSEYKNLKLKFKKDYKEILKKFINENYSMEGYENYIIVDKIFNLLDMDKVYKLMKLERDEWNDYFASFFNNDELLYLNNFIEINNIENINELYSEIKVLKDRLDPKIKIIVSKELEEFVGETEKTNITLDDSLIEGLKIYYRGELIDFSLQGDLK